MSFESRNPATGELLGTYPEHDKAEIEVRLQRAWDGWQHWSYTPLQERIAFLPRLADYQASSVTALLYEACSQWCGLWPRPTPRC